MLDYGPESAGQESQIPFLLRLRILGGIHS